MSASYKTFGIRKQKAEIMPWKAYRNRRGIWIASMVSLGLISLLCLFATTSLIIGSYGRMTSERARDIMRNTAESGLDWAVSQFNDPATIGNVEPTNSAARTVTMPSSMLPTGYTGTILVQKGQPPNYTYLYNPSYDPTKTANILGDTNFRIITATMTAPSGKKKSLRVILTPTYTLSSTTTTTTTPTTTTTMQNVPFFSYAMFSQNQIALNGGVYTRSYDSENNPSQVRHNGHVGTNTGITMNGSASIDGDLTVTPVKTNNTVVTLNGEPRVTGRLQTSGGVSNPSYASLNHWVLDSNGQGNLIKADIPQTEIGPTVSPPATLPSGTLPNYNTYSSYSLSTPGSYGAMNLNGNAQLTITAGGDYSFSSLVLNGSTSISIAPNITSPVNIYIRNGGSLTLNGATTLNNNSGLPKNVRIWHQGGGSITLNGGTNMKAVVFAPNTPVTVNGNSPIYGSVVAKSVTLNGSSSFIYDEALGRLQNLTWQKPVTTTTTTSTTSTVSASAFNHYQTVSWEEL